MITATTHNLSSARIVIVDDNRNFLRILRSVLRASGVHGTFEAVSAYEALEFLRLNEVDLVLTDYAMPEIDGFELVSMIRSDSRLASRSVPIICISGHAERRTVENAVRAGADDFIVKPIRARDVYQHVLKHLQNPLLRIRTMGYVGPDRRRLAICGYFGPDRRAVISEIDDIFAAVGNAA